MSLFNKLHGGSQGPSRAGKLVTTKMFLGKEGYNPYMAPEEVVSYAKSLRPHELEQMEEYFHCLKRGLRQTGPVITRIDKGNRPYQHPLFHDTSSTPTMKVIIEGGMKAFVADCRSGAIHINFTFDELIEEALN